MVKISVVLAVYNEEGNLKDCLESVKDLADEIVIVDGGSTDKTVEIAREFKAKVTVTTNPPIFHINKQKALEKASNSWILQLDADERVTKELAKEIKEIVEKSDDDLEHYQDQLSRKQLFLRHQKLIEQRDGRIGSNEGPYIAFFIPRLNYFLGRYLKYGGVYPDGVIRLVKKNLAHFPCKSVHEQIAIVGRVGWLNSDLIHMADPTFERYIQRNNRYVKLLAQDLAATEVSKNPFQLVNYMIIKPVHWFILTYVRHKGILDGLPGLIFSFYSALRFPKAYLKYLKND